MKSFDAFQHARKIWILRQVVDAGNLRRAAQQIKVSPAAISQSITALEKAAGGPLIVRGPGSVTPTELARSILRIAAPALESLGAFAQLGANGEAPGGEFSHIAWISLGSYESLAVDVLPRLTSRLAERLPKLKITVRVSRSGNLATMVRKGELCAALVTETDALEGLHTIDVAEDRLGFFVHASCGAEVRNWDAIAAGRLGTISPGPDGYPRYYTRFVQSTLGKNFRPAVLSDSFEALRALASSGCMPTILPTRVAGRVPGELVEITPPRPAEAGRHRICLASQPSCDPAEIRLLTDELRGIFATVNASASASTPPGSRAKSATAPL